MTIGDRIKKLMESKGWHHQKDLVKKTGITQSTLSGIFNNSDRSPRIDILMKIATALDVTVNDLAYSEEEKARLQDITPSSLGVRSELIGTDIKMARVVEELIDILSQKNMIDINDFSLSSQETLSRRKILRSRI